jgi:predicted amidohydrolase
MAFNGGSFALSPEGEVLLELPLLEEAEGDVEIDRDALEALRRRRPLLANERHDLYAAAFGSRGA